MSRTFSFFRAGGFNQVRFDSGADLVNLDRLDQKLWVALACPTQGLVFDARTLELIDTDHDGRIRAAELIAAVKWAGSLLNNVDDLLSAPAELPLSAINTEQDEGRHVLHAAKTLLQGMGKADADTLSVADTANALIAFNQMRFNGDGVLTVDSADDLEAKALIADILATMGGVEDRSGKQGVNTENVAEFFKTVGEYITWFDQAQTDKAWLPLQADTGIALTALNVVRAKIDDYFVRCQLAVFDARAVAALNRDEKEYYALSVQELVISNDDIRRLPLARIEGACPLPLGDGVNPAWVESMQAFVSRVINPLLGEITHLSEIQWRNLKHHFTQYEAWQRTKVGAAVETLGIDRLRTLSLPEQAQRLDALFAAEKEQETAAQAIASVERLVRYVRDIYKLAINFVSFQQFYQRKAPAIFQVGTLYLDQRTCELCVRVEDVGRHSAMAALSRTYLAYCDCSRPATGEKMTIAAAFTDGDSDNLMVGRNGIFYDREGKDWDAMITKLVDNPISLRQAFWSPYKKLMRFIEDQVAKRASAGDVAANNLLTGAVTQVSTAADAGKVDAAGANKKIDIGVVAALGVAVGGIAAAFGAILQAFFGLGFWMPLGIAGLMLLISGPSMLIAWLKLRQRNIGPLLDANGWAVNANALVNVPFGSSLTKVASLPKGARLDSFDPFAEKQRPWKFYVTVAVLILMVFCWLFGKLDPLLPSVVKSVTVLGMAENVADNVIPTGSATPSAEK